MKPEAARDATYYRASPELRERVGASLAAEARTSKAPGFRFSLMLAASFAAVALLTWNVAVWTLAPPPDEAIARDVVAAHVRSLMTPGRLADVASSDQHTVKPWFAGKLDFAPPVRDLAPAGFPLTGGRLDYVNGRSVAALTYTRRLHTVTLFLWPAKDAAETAPRLREMNGYSMVHWTRGGMSYWAISDASPVEVEAFATAVSGS